MPKRPAKRSGQPGKGRSAAPKKAASRPQPTRKAAPRSAKPGSNTPARTAAKPAAGRAAREESPAAGQPPVAAAPSGKYVYCIMQATAPLRFGPIGIGSEPAEVHTVNYQDIAAVVSDTPLEVYDPTRENVLAHERVNEAVMKRFTVIPMSFNTVFKTREDIVELLRTAYDAFRDVLGKMEDKLEFGLKIVWEPEIVIREIEKENENIRLLREQISSQKGSTYFARMQYGRLVDSLLQERSERLVAEIFQALSDVSVASRANKPIGDKMILNAAFLVPRDREADFDAKVKEVDARHANLKLKYTGPWPPYNFVNIRLKLERATDAE
ncbi:MAG TPA: GvpL/GvpF family gas vesicle protein [Thermoanaerobaculia bacterium]